MVRVYVVCVRVCACKWLTYRRHRSYYVDVTPLPEFHEVHVCVCVWCECVVCVCVVKVRVFVALLMTRRDAVLEELYGAIGEGAGGDEQLTPRRQAR